MMIEHWLALAALVFCIGLVIWGFAGLISPRNRTKDGEADQYD